MAFPTQLYEQLHRERDSTLPIRYFFFPPINLTERLKPSHSQSVMVTSTGNEAGTSSKSDSAL